MEYNNELNYEAMLSSIDFFSQNLHLEQIVEYGFGIFNSFEKPLASAIYVYDEPNRSYVPRFTNGYLISLPEIEKKPLHDSFAVRNGFLLEAREVQSRYFDDAFLSNAEVSKIMPLIVDDKLFGFIISTDGELANKLSISFLTRFNYLMNLSLEKASRYIERAKLRNEIDKRIFNINSISHIMKILLTELDTDRIVNLSMDVIKELTTSSVTSMGLYDEIEGVVSIKSYSNLIEDKKGLEVFELKRQVQYTDKMLYRYPEEIDLLEDLFEDTYKFERLDAEYVILLAKDELLGLVTLGKPLVNEIYEQTQIERICDIASIVYIALVNSNQFKTIKDQKTQLQTQVDVMKSMNRIIKNISSAESLDELSDMITVTMSMTFGVETMLFMIRDKDRYIVRGYFGLEMDKLDVNFYEEVNMHMDSEIVVRYTIDEAKAFWGETYNHYFPDGNCMILAPVYMSQLHRDPVGYILIARTTRRLKEAQVSSVEVLANSIGPTLFRLQAIKQFENHYTPKSSYKLISLYEKYGSESLSYSLDFQVCVKKVAFMPFEIPDLSGYEGLDHVYCHGVIVFFTCEPVSNDLYDMVSRVNPSFEDVKNLIFRCSH